LTKTKVSDFDTTNPNNIFLNHSRLEDQSNTTGGIDKGASFDDAALMSVMHYKVLM